MRKSLWSLSLLFGTLGALTAANAGTICTVPDSVTLNILPTGCGAFLTNGPILYTGVVATGGDIFNIEVDSVELFGLNTGANTINVFIQGISTDITASTVTNFSNLSTSTFFQTVPLNNGYAVDTGTQIFPIAHFIDTLPGVFTLKLNFGEAGKPDQSAFDVVTSAVRLRAQGFSTSAASSTFTRNLL